MVLDAAEGEPVLVDADDGGDDADMLAGMLQHAALLDMRLEVAAIAPVLQFDARCLGEPGRRQRIMIRGQPFRAELHIKTGEKFFIRRKNLRFHFF